MEEIKMKVVSKELNGGTTTADVTMNDENKVTGEVSKQPGDEPAKYYVDDIQNIPVEILSKLKIGDIVIEKIGSEEYRFVYAYTDGGEHDLVHVDTYTVTAVIYYSNGDGTGFTFDDTYRTDIPKRVKVNNFKAGDGIGGTIITSEADDVSTPQLLYNWLFSHGYRLSQDKHLYGIWGFDVSATETFSRLTADDNSGANSYLCFTSNNGHLMHEIDINNQTQINLNWKFSSYIIG